MKKNRIVIPGQASLVSALSDAVLKNLTDNRFKVFTSDMAGHGRNFTIRKGNIFLGFFGCSRSVKLSIFNQGNDLVADLKCSFIGLHITLLILLLLMIPPLHIGVLIALTPFGWIFIAAHIAGLIIQILFLKRLLRFIEDFCKKNKSVPRFCPNCGKPLNEQGKCPGCESRNDGQSKEP